MLRIVPRIRVMTAAVAGRGAPLRPVPSSPSMSSAAAGARRRAVGLRGHDDRDAGGCGGVRLARASRRAARAGSRVHRGGDRAAPRATGGEPPPARRRRCCHDRPQRGRGRGGEPFDAPGQPGDLEAGQLHQLDECRRRGDRRRRRAPRPGRRSPRRIAAARSRFHRGTPRWWSATVLRHMATTPVAPRPSTRARLATWPADLRRRGGRRGRRRRGRASAGWSPHPSSRSPPTASRRCRARGSRTAATPSSARATSRRAAAASSWCCPPAVHQPRRAADVTVTGRLDSSLGSGSYRATGCAG